MSAAMETNTPRPVMPVVTIREDGVFTSSRDVATYFEKQHAHVLRSIDDLVAQGCRSNFGEGSYTLPSTGSQTHRTYDMDRDGFMLLAMGFTGVKALQWKLRYIEAFKIMEAELTRLKVLDGAYGDRRDYPSTDGQLLWGQPISKVNAVANLMSTVLRSFGPEAARELYRREPTMPGLDGYTVGAALERNDADGEGCLTHLLRHAAENGLSIGRMLELARNDSVTAARLQRFGIAARPAKNSLFFAVATRHSFLSRVFSDTAWVGEWAAALESLDGARPDRTRRKFGTEVSVAVLVPAALAAAATYH